MKDEFMWGTMSSMKLQPSGIWFHEQIIRDNGGIYKTRHYIDAVTAEVKEDTVHIYVRSNNIFNEDDANSSTNLKKLTYKKE